LIVWDQATEKKPAALRFVDTCSESDDIRMDLKWSLLGVLDEEKGKILFCDEPDSESPGTLVIQHAWGKPPEPIVELPVCPMFFPHRLSPDGRWFVGAMGDEHSTLLVVDLTSGELRRVKNPGPYAHFAGWADDGPTMHALFRCGDHCGVGTYKTTLDKESENLAKMVGGEILRPYRTFELDLATGDHWEVPHDRLVFQRSANGNAVMNLVKAELHVTRGEKLTRIGLSDHQRYLLEIGSLSWANDRFMLMRGDENYRHCFVDSTTGRKNIVIRKGDHGQIEVSSLFKKAAFARNSKSNVYLADIFNDDE